MELLFHQLPLTPIVKQRRARQCKKQRQRDPQGNASAQAVSELSWQFPQGGEHCEMATVIRQEIPANVTIFPEFAIEV
ncbi:MAG: hypothetical protein HZB20_11925 [Chloroflexi bacterium]|nr:hypothetical protein [Chloroflexota bacterium]